MTLTLLLLTLRGSLIFLLVVSLDSLCARRMSSVWRRSWWLLVPLAFLLPIGPTPLHVPVPIQVPTAWQTAMSIETSSLTPAPIAAAPIAYKSGSIPWLELIWMAGMVISSLGILIPTFRAYRLWSRIRLSTDPALLNLLEDCKGCAGVTAPIGLVVSDQVTAPALLGWLRPRILLPAHLATPNDALRAVFLHELAHFRTCDIPLNWLFALIRIVHWFNPLAWLAMSAWSRFREEAADENAIRWIGKSSSRSYGEILLETLKNCQGGATPCGALAIGESIQHLKRRIIMIRHYPSKTNHTWLALTIVFLLAGLMTVAPSLAQDDAATVTKKETDQAVAAMQTWLAEMDDGKYDQSWTDASDSFKKAVTSDKWVALSTSVRTPLGKLKDRKLASAMYQTGLMSTGTIMPGQFVIAQFETSFENLQYARETVTFEKDAGGAWKASGYYIKPR